MTTSLRLRPLSHLRMRPLAVLLTSALSSSPAFAGHPAPVPQPSAAWSFKTPPFERSTPATPFSTNVGTDVVSNCNDSGAGSLRQVIADAGSGQTIDLSDLPCSTITLTSGEIAIAQADLLLSGPGSDQLAIDANGASRIFNHGGTGALTLNGVTVRNGVATDDGGCIYEAGSIVLTDVTVSHCQVSSDNGSVGGGGIDVRQDLRLYNSRILDNTATAPFSSAGGGILVGGDAIIANSTFTGNVAGDNGGGLSTSHDATIYGSTFSGNSAYFGGAASFSGFGSPSLGVGNSTISGNNAAVGGGLFADGAIDVYNSTIAFNTAANALRGGGLYITGPSVLRNTIVANDIANGAPDDIDGNAVATIGGTNNLIMASRVPVPPDTLSSDPQLGPLADNGGPTWTRALLSGSPAIDAGDSTLGFTYDQRSHGFARVVGGAVDIGAYEVQSSGTTHTVSNCADSGSGSLRDAANSASSGDVIDLRHLSCSTITLTTGALQIPLGNLNLLGPGAQALTIDGDQQDRVINHSGSGTLTLSGLTLANGSYDFAEGLAYGGCVHSASTLDVSDSILTGCRVTGAEAWGGAISAHYLSIAGSTLSDNGAEGIGNGYARGGGVFTDGGLDMVNCSITGNTTPASVSSNRGRGGGVASFGTASISGSTLAGNQAAIGGGLYAYRQATVTNSTVSGNTGLVVAGVFARYAGVSIRNSTIAFNVSVYANTPSSSSGLSPLGSGLFAYGPIELQSTIVFGNTTNGTPYDVGVASGGRIVGANNLVGASPVVLPPGTLHDDPLLGPLQDNGGSTWTHALSAGSPAIDHGNNDANLTDDQRGAGFARVAGGAADIGAFEVQAAGDTIFLDGFDGG